MRKICLAYAYIFLSLSARVKIVANWYFIILNISCSDMDAIIVDDTFVFTSYLISKVAFCFDSYVLSINCLCVYLTSIGPKVIFDAGWTIKFGFWNADANIIAFD